MATSTIGGTSPDYATISSWESAKGSGTFTSPEIGLCRAATFSEFQIIFDGAVTDATNRWELKADTGAEHNGVEAAGAIVEASFNSTGWAVITQRDEDFYIEQLEFRAKAGQGTRSAVNVDLASADIQANQCLVHDADSVITSSAVASTTATIRWVSGWDLTGSGALHGDSADTTAWVIENCVFIRQSVDGDILASGVRYLKTTNVVCYFYGPTSGHADFLNTGTGSDYNGCHDTSAPGANSLDNKTVSEFTAYDDHSLASGSVFESAGTNLSNGPDIGGNSLSNYSIGVWDAVAGGGGGTTIPAVDEGMLTGGFMPLGGGLE